MYSILMQIYKNISKTKIIYINNCNIFCNFAWLSQYISPLHIMLGTITNVATIVAGSCLGSILKKRIRPEAAYVFNRSTISFCPETSSKVFGRYFSIQISGDACISYILIPKADKVCVAGGKKVTGSSAEQQRTLHPPRPRF